MRAVPYVSVEIIDKELEKLGVIEKMTVPTVYVKKKKEYAQIIQPDLMII